MVRAVPVYEVSQGVIFLAQKSGAPVVPIHMEYSSCWRFKSWDRFILPRPFSTVRADLRAPHSRSRRTASPEEFEKRTAPFAKCDDESGGTKNEYESGFVCHERSQRS